MKGKLILSTSYAPGAGKTFHMLLYANSLAQRCSVYYGYVNHQPGRAFTQSDLNKLQKKLNKLT